MNWITGIIRSHCFDKKKSRQKGLIGLRKRLKDYYWRKPRKELKPKNMSKHVGHRKTKLRMNMQNIKGIIRL